MSRKNQKTQEQSTTKKGLTTGQKVGICTGAIGGGVGLGFGIKKMWDHFHTPKFEEEEFEEVTDEETSDDEAALEREAEAKTGEIIDLLKRGEVDAAKLQYNSYCGPFADAGIFTKMVNAYVPQAAESEPATEDEGSEEKLYKDFISGKPVTPVYPDQEKMDEGQLHEVYRDAAGMSMAAEEPGTEGEPASVFEPSEEEIDVKLHVSYDTGLACINSMWEIVNSKKFYTNFPFRLATDRDKCISVSETLRGTKYHDPFVRMMSKVIDACNEKIIAVLSGECEIECWYDKNFKFETFGVLTNNLGFIGDEVYGAKIIGDDDALRDAARRYTEQFILLIMYIGGGCESYESVPIATFKGLMDQYKLVRKYSIIPGSGDYLWDIVPVTDIKQMLEKMEKLEQTESDDEEIPQESEETTEPVESNPEPTEEEPVPGVTEDPAAENDKELPSEDELIALDNAIDKISVVLEKDEIKSAAEQFNKYCEPYYSKRDLLDKDLADRLVDLSQKLIAKAVENGWTVNEKPAEEAQPEVTEEVTDEEGEAEDYSSLIHDMQRIEEMMSRNDIMGAKNVFAKCCAGYMNDSRLAKDNAQLFEDLHGLAARVDEAWDKLPKRGAAKKRRR